MSDKLTFRALKLSNEQRNAYGLRYHDYERYRKHCANRTHRLRSTLKMTHGKGREFKALPPLKTEAIQNGHLELLLMESERAWAYSQDLLAQSRKDDAHASSLRHNATGRFRRSVKWANELLTHAKALTAASRLSAASLLEVYVYTLIVDGRFQRYRESFDDALVQLSVARHLLDELAASATTSKDQALAVLFADSIGPEIRYSAHELGRPESYNIDKIVAQEGVKHRDSLVEDCAQLLQTFKTEEVGSESNKRQKLEQIIWEGEPVPIRNPELVDVFLKAQDAQAKLERDGQGKMSSKKRVAAYDTILLALSDAEEVARKLMEAQKTTGTAVPSGSRDIQFVHAYIVYELLSRRIQRDLILVHELVSKAKDVRDGRVYSAVVKLYDAIMQSLNQMRILSIVDDNPDLSAGVDARIAFTKAERCLYLARCFGYVKQYAEAFTLYKHSAIHVREAQSHLDLSPPPAAFYELTPDKLAKHQAVVGVDEQQFKREWLQYNGGSKDLDPKKYVKPPFYNIAVNYVEMDMDALARRAGLEVPDVQPEPVQEKKRSTVQQEERKQPEPEPQVVPASGSRGGLGALLGGWWGK
ncbi:hypothetical protein CYLTODRAFT_457145 [Cylindrobasidium torrendii FP15055 ss-10]|uniref:Signal recognition particle subunit SRP68 n=1 Tax=Cylindrobasidium torrendii FP15055 ss-10 TaxID=1314674 RepID=A0A0D7B4R6_9AGAR|nr:hypothetical protein CYLTODRAFT_457145 [Cylindrobasidium torrendii FP15055 ss-10]